MTLPSNLNIIYAKPHATHEAPQEINPEHWLANHESWNRANYVKQITELLGPSPTLATTSKVFMLASQVEAFVTCQIHIKRYGLTISQNNGVTTGQNPHFKIADAALYRAVQLMKELGLGSGSKSVKQLQNSKWAALIAGPDALPKR